MNQAERSYLEAARRSSREALEALGVRPYAYRWDRSHLAAEAVAAYRDEMGEDGPEVSVAGRLVSWRSQGKTAFGHVADRSGRIQLYLRMDVGEPPARGHLRIQSACPRLLFLRRLLRRQVPK